MTHFKKIIMIVLLVAFAGIWGYLVYQVNANYPAAKNIAITEGEEGRYKGLRITPEGLEICSYEEAVDKYPELVSSYSSLDDEGTSLTGEMDLYNYVFVHIKIRNTMDTKLSMGKESILYWPIEVNGIESNCMDMFQFTQMNPSYSRTFEAGKEIELILPYAIYKEHVSLEELKKSELKIVYSYYPTKNYILYKGDNA